MAENPKIPLKMIRDYVAGLTPDFLRKDIDQTTAAKITANGFDANNNQITSVADGTADNHAMTLGQGKAIATRGAFLGKIYGYVRVVDSVVEFVHDSNGNGVNEISASPVSNQLYLLISNAVLGGNAYEKNDVVLFNGTVYICDNSLNTFDASSAAAESEGGRDGAEYIIKVNAESGDVLPNYAPGFGSWGDGARIKWNPEYDSSGDDNIGRWNDNGSEANVPLGSKDVAGILKPADGFDVAGGVISIALDTTDNPISLTGSSPNKKIKFNFITSAFKVVAGVFQLFYQDTDTIALSENASGFKADVKDGSLALAKLDATLQSNIAGKVNNTELAFKTGHLGRSRIYNGANLLQFFQLITGSTPTYSTTDGGLNCGGTNGIFTVKIPVLTGKEYRLRVRAKNSGVGAQMFWGSRKYDYAGALMDDLYNFFSAQNTTSSYVDYVSSKVVFAAGVRFIDLRFDIEAGVIIEEMVFEEVSGALHDHTIAQVTGLQAILDTIADNDTVILKGNLNEEFTPALTSSTNTTGYVNLTLSRALRVGSVINLRSLVNIYINGVGPIPQHTDCFDILETVADNEIWQVVKLKHAGLGFDLDGTDDVVSIELKD